MPRRATGLRVRLFGTSRAEVDGATVGITARKQRAVLAMLALEAGRPVGTDTLIDGIWGEEPPDTARTALQVYVSDIRAALGVAAASLRTTPGGYALDIDPGDVDVLSFARAVEATRDGIPTGESLREALDRWLGGPLADLLDLPFAGAWSTRLHELRLAALDELFDAELAAGRHAAIVPELKVAVVVQPYRERTWRQLVLALYRDGRQADALAAFMRCRRVLVEELGIDPGPALAALEHAILVQDPALDLAPSAQPLGLRVPRRATDLVGRGRELAAAAALVVDQRLVTLTGPGGVGKTSLAVEAALAAAPAFPDGVVVVELATVRDPGILLAEVARALDADGTAGEVLEAIAARLAGRRVLVVLDNLEQVPDAAAAVARLVARVPGLHVLATTRASLRIRGEELLRLAPLKATDAMAMFDSLTARVGSADPAVGAEVVARLEGLPLAIELAAAACRVLPPRDVLDRIARREPLPAAPRDLPDRHRTIHDSLAWSMDLLPPESRRTMLRLAAFEAPFALHAAQALTGDTDVVESLAELVDASLLLHDDERFRMLQPIRELARAIAAQEDADWADLHAEWVLGATRAAVPRLRGRDEPAALAELTAILPDLRAAIDRLVAVGRHDAAMQILLDTRLVWYMAGLMRELTARLDAASEGRLSPLMAAEAAVVRAAYAHIFGEPDAMERLQATNAVLAGLDATSIVLVNGLCHLAALEADAGDGASALANADDAVRIARDCGDPATHALALDLAGYVARTLGDVDRAIAATREAAELARASGSPQLVSSLAGYAAALGDGGYRAEAIAAAWEALDLAQASGSPQLTAEAAMTVGPVLGAADPGAFGSSVAGSMATYVALGALVPLLETGTCLVQMAADAGLDDAVTLAGALQRRARREMPVLATAVAALEARLGPATAARLRGRGASIDDDELARFAVRLATQVATH